MSLIKLEINNFRGVKAICIEPTSGPVTVIGGKNGAGKSSVLDALEWLFRGPAANIAEPVRIGADKAEVVAEVNGYRITRVQRAGGTMSLKVEHVTDSTKPVKPQAFLDTMFESGSFDPGAFARAKPAEQRKMMLDAFRPTVAMEGLAPTLEVIGMGGEQTRAALSLDDVASLIKRAEEMRTGANRAVRETNDALIPYEGQTYPTEPMSAAGIKAEQVAYETALRAKRDQDAKRADLDKRVVAYSEKMVALEKQFKAACAALAELEAEIELERKEPELPEPVKPDIDAALAQIAEHNRAVETGKLKATLTSKADAACKRATQLNDAVACLREARDGAVNSLDLAALIGKPVSLDDDQINVGGVPLQGLSTAEAIEIGCSVVMAQNPKLSLIRIKEGNDLDSSTLGRLADVAAQRGWQVLIERVMESPSEGAIYIEAGEVVA